MTRIRLIVLAAAGSAALLASAYVFQALGYEPCKLCHWQRWPHMAAIAIGVLALVWQPSVQLALLGALATASTAALGVYHTGVEQKWWIGPDSCTSGPISSISAQDLLNRIMTAPLVRCDEASWTLFGISMAGYNAIASAVLVAIWLSAARQK
jgi:disulfide bond formation protein DsbB